MTPHCHNGGRCYQALNLQPVKYIISYPNAKEKDNSLIFHVFSEKRAKKSVAEATLFWGFELADDTGSFDTLYQESLAEQVNDDQGCNNQQTASISESGDIQVTCREVCFKRLGRHDDIGHQSHTGAGEEDGGIEVIRPLPAECKQEDGNHHRDGQRNDDSEECHHRAAAVQVSGFFKFVRDTAVELSHHEDIQTVSVSQTGDGEQSQRPVGVIEVDGCEVDQLEAFGNTAAQEVEYSENIEISEFHEHGELKC